MLANNSTTCFSFSNSPLNLYQALVDANKISFDVAQQQAVELLQQLYLALQPTRENVKKNSVIKGIYLWGKVGRGKTIFNGLIC